MHTSHGVRAMHVAHACMRTMLTMLAMLTMLTLKVGELNVALKLPVVRHWGFKFLRIELDALLAVQVGSK